jgi:hypothetical protein
MLLYLFEACVVSAAAQQAVPPSVSFTQASPPAIVPTPSLAFDLAKPDEVGPVGTYQDEKRPLIIMGLPAGHSETRIFTIRNTGPLATGPMHFWIEGEDGNGPSRIVKLDPDSDCITRGAAPNETCSVSLTVTAVADGEFMAHVRFLAGIRNGPPRLTLRTILEIHGYGTGFGTKLPDKVVGNGALCPVIGARAEIALSSVVGRETGYPQHEPKGLGLILSTVECEKVESTSGRMESKAGRSCERPVLKLYKAPSVGGPWTLFSQREGTVRFVALLCENDILKLVQVH